MNPKPRAVVFDLDGTLAESKQPITTEMAGLLVQLMHHTTIVVMTGGSWSQIEAQFLSSFPPGTDFSHMYLFPDNAAQCFTRRGGGWNEEYDMSFSSKERDEIIEVLHRAITDSGFPKPPQLWGQQIEDRGGQISFSPLGQHAPLEAKKEWRAAHDADREHLRGILSAQLPHYSVRSGGETTIDITRTGITKAYGLRKLTELTGTPTSDMIYVGDALQEGGNDSVVIETGVRTHAVIGPQDTEIFIKQLIS
jgi:phosphomannomutase